MQQSSEIIEFSTCYHRYKQVVYNYALKMAGNRMAADDMVQSVFLKLYEHFSGIRNKESISYWLFKSVRNEVYAYFRTKRIAVNQISAEEHPDCLQTEAAAVELQYELNNMREIVRAELEQLPIEQKDVLLLREYGGFSYREISEMLQIDEELVKSRLFKARAKLVKKLQPMFD